MDSVTFTVYGIPRPQGSKRPLPNGIMVEASKYVASWRGSVSDAAGRAMNGAPLFDGPLRVQVSFVFPRPKSHYRTGRHSDELKPCAPAFHTSAPDIDKLERAILDALKGVAISDDKVVCRVEKEKLYGPRGSAMVTISRVPQP